MIVARHRVRDERLQPSVPDVLQSLPVWRIHVSIMRVEPSGAPTNLPDRSERTIARLKRSFFCEGIGGEPTAYGFSGHRLILALDVDFQVAPGSPTERHEFVRGRTGQKLVDEAQDMFAFDFIAVSFFAI